MSTTPEKSPVVAGVASAFGAGPAARVPVIAITPARTNAERAGKRAMRMLLAPTSVSDISERTSSLAGANAVRECRPSQGQTHRPGRGRGLWERAAAAGDTGAMANVGDLLAQPHPPEPATARAWLERAAESGVRMP